MTRNRSKEATVWSEDGGDITSLETSRGLGSRTPWGERRVSGIRGLGYDLEVGPEENLSSVPSRARPSSTPRTLADPGRRGDSGTVAMDNLPPRTASSQVLTVGGGARVGWFAPPKCHDFA
jgi:hypothetical protein